MYVILNCNYIVYCIIWINSSKYYKTATNTMEKIEKKCYSNDLICFF